MRSLFIVLALVMMSAATLAQHVDNGGGGVSIESKRRTKAVPTMSREGKVLPARVGNGGQEDAGLIDRVSDITQVSTFPFQAPYDTYLSYYESCPLALGNGNLLVVYADPNRDTLYSVKSTDGGTTWSSPAFVTLPWFVQSLSGIRTAQGRIILVWGSGIIINGTSYGLWMCNSDNDGVTWSAATPISNNLGDYYTTISQTLNGRLWLCYSRYNATTSYDTYCRTSTDNGTSWSAEKGFLTTPYSEVYATVVSKDTSTIIAFDADDSSGGLTGIYARTSTDSGTTWSSPSAISTALTTETRPRVLRQADGTLWLVYQYYNSSTGGFTQSEIACKKSTDGGTNWSAASYLTNYAGYDGWFNTCLFANQPFVTFASYRWCVLMGQTHLWYGLMGTSADNNTPPTLTSSYASISGQGNNESIVAYVDDDTGISNVQLWYHLNGAPYGPDQMYDDGLHGDNVAGDRIYGATIGAFQIGDVGDYSIGITDINSNYVSVYVNSFALPAIHNAGNITLQISANSELGDLGYPGFSAHWPKTNGYDYLYDGGLWVGCNVGGQNVVVNQFYNLTPSWSRTSATSFTLGPGISDQDGNVTYDDLLAYQRIGLQIHQQSYQWSQSTWSDFIIFKYTITNTGVNGNLNNVYVGLWTDPDVAVETNAFSDSIGYDFQRHMVYAYNTQNLPTGYFGVKLLGAGTAPSSVYSWRSSQLIETATSMPFYQCLTHGGTTLPDSIGDVRMLLTASPFSLASNASMTVQFGIVLGDGLAALQANADTMEAVFDSKLATSIEPASAGNTIPKEFSLGQNYPNPFNPLTIIRYGLPQRSYVFLSVFNALGQRVATLVQGEVEAGYHEVRFDGSGLASGVYFYRIQAGTYVETKKLLLIR